MILTRKQLINDRKWNPELIDYYMVPHQGYHQPLHDEYLYAKVVQTEMKLNRNGVNWKVTR